MIYQKTSPNFSIDRSGYKPEIIVLHIMDGTLSGTDGWFADPLSQVSSHYGIGFSGEIHQYVKDDNTAWTQGLHNGATFKLHKPGVNPNLYCLSIEHEGSDLSIAPQTQLDASVALIKVLCSKWNIPIDREHIIGHYEVDPFRKPFCPSSDKSIIDRIVKMAQQATEVICPPVTDKLPLFLAELDTLIKKYK